MQNTNYKRLLLVVVILALLFVAGFLLKKYARGPVSDIPDSASDSATTSVQIRTSPPTTSFDNLEKRPEKDQIISVEGIKSSAEDTNTVTVNKGCLLDPVTARIKEGETLVFVNKDVKKHLLIVNGAHTIDPGKKLEIKAVFNGPGLYGVSCDAPGPHGFIEIY